MQLIQQRKSDTRRPGEQWRRGERVGAPATLRHASLLVVKQAPSARQTLRTRTKAQGVVCLIRLQCRMRAPRPGIGRCSFEKVERELVVCIPDVRYVRYVD